MYTKTCQTRKTVKTQRNSTATHKNEKMKKKKNTRRVKETE